MTGNSPTLKHITRLIRFSAHGMQQLHKNRLKQLTDEISEGRMRDITLVDLQTIISKYSAVISAQFVRPTEILKLSPRRFFLDCNA